MAGITQVSNDENLDGIVRDRQQHALARATSETDDASGITRMEWEKRATAEGIEPAFMAKVEVLNAAIREIGMGRYQYELFFTAGRFCFLFTLYSILNCVLQFAFHFLGRGKIC